MFRLRYRPFTLLAIVTVVLGFYFTPHPTTLFEQIFAVVTHHGLLISDLMAIGLGGSFVNAGLIVLLILFVMERVGCEMNGLEIAGLLTVFGFAFFGKTLFAIWPPFIGVLIMAKLQKKPLKSILPVAMFATAAAPAVAIMLYTFAGYGTFVALMISLVVGLSVGMAVQLMASHIKTLHDGMILYNIGFTLGFVLLFFFSTLKAFGFTLSAYSGEILSTNQMELIILILIVNIGFILYGFYVRHIDNRPDLGCDCGDGSGACACEPITSVVTTSDIGDYVQNHGYASTLVNVGFLGLFSLAYVLLCQGKINGPIMAGIFTVAGFGAFGKTFRNIVPILLGATLMSLISKGPVNLATTSSIITALFATALAPITKKYGFLVGVVFGMAHSIVVANTGALHGYMSLYNNAFAMGLVVLILKPFADAYYNKTWSS